MSADDSAHAHLQTLLEYPSRYQEILAEYNGERDCYEDLLQTAKRTLTSFDEYHEFYEVMIQEGPTDLVTDDLNRNVARSLKNMVLRSSQAGRQFPIFTATELEQRIEAYQDLGANNLTERSVIFTLLEQLFDEDQDTLPYEVVSRLCRDLPTGDSVIAEILTRARFVLATTAASVEGEAINHLFEKLYTDLPNPLPDVPREASELFEAADQTPFSDPTKVELVRASLVREPALEVLEEYLYLSARDVIERYRHSSRNDPYRGELQLAIRQCNSYQSLFDDAVSVERSQRMTSYLYLALGELRSGGRWRSTRDQRDLPDADFASAAGFFAQAATAIEPVDADRFLKYVSKSVRYQATAAHHREIGPADGWETSQQLHEWMIEIAPQIADDVSQDGDREVDETATGMAAFHQFRARRAAAVVAVKHGDPDRALSEVETARELVNAVPTYVNMDFLNTIRELAEARQQELLGEYNSALDRYKSINHSAFDVDIRPTLVKIKQALEKKDSDTAVKIAEESLPSPSPITAAVQLIAGEPTASLEVQNPSIDSLSCAPPAEKRAFVLLTNLAAHVEADTDAYIPAVESMLYEL